MDAPHLWASRSASCKDWPPPVGVSTYPCWQQALDTMLQVGKTHTRGKLPALHHISTPSKCFLLPWALTQFIPLPPTLSPSVSKFDFAGRIRPRDESSFLHQDNHFLSLFPYSLACDKSGEEKGCRKERQTTRNEEESRQVDSSLPPPMHPYGAEGCSSKRSAPLCFLHALAWTELLADLVWAWFWGLRLVFLFRWVFFLGGSVGFLGFWGCFFFRAIPFDIHNLHEDNSRNSVELYQAVEQSWLNSLQRALD